jgi:flagellar hook-associated protein 3 FlgL
MGVRITQAMMIRTALADVTRARERLATSQERASSGLRINRPSDDPSGASAALLLRAGLDATEQFIDNVSRSKARIEATESVLADSVDLLVRAKELALAGANDTQDATSRRQIAREVEGLHASLVAQANSSFSGGYLFAGFASDAPPFEVTGVFADTPPSEPAVAFVGDSNELEVAIDQGLTVRVGFDGRRVFMGDADGDGSPEPGHQDLFQVLADLRNALMLDDAVAIRAMLPRIDEGFDQLGEERTAVGASGSRLENWDQRLARRSEDLQSRLSDTQDADAAKVYSDLIQQQTALEAGLQAMSQLVHPSLLDFLR